MVQISFIKALKLPWLRRIILLSHNNHNDWNSLAILTIKDICKLRDKYGEMYVHVLSNPFWIDLVTSWQEFCERVRIETLEEILYSPI